MICTLKHIVITLALAGNLLTACDHPDHKKNSGTRPTVPGMASLKPGVMDEAVTDSSQLLALTKQLYYWVEEESVGADFEPYLTKEDDSLYAGINLKLQQTRLKEMEESGLFTQNFVSNYKKIATAINKELKTQGLIWNIGMLPPFGNGANPWCNCQDAPDNYLDKIWIMNLSYNVDTASYNWSWGEGLVYHIKAIKTKEGWKIAYVEGFDFDNFTRSFIYTNRLEGSWTNNLVRIDISDEMLTIWYHGQCVYFYPIRKINDQSIEMIWDRDMDCKFDNGTHLTFGLKKTPSKGQPFAKFTLQHNKLYVQYYYQEWVQQYSKQVQQEVFTSTYTRIRE